MMQLGSRCLCCLGEHLVLANQCPVYVGQQKSNVLEPVHNIYSDGLSSSSKESHLSDRWEQPFSEKRRAANASGTAD
jgi:hypothetical protein